jgi:hypothetical protein
LPVSLRFWKCLWGVDKVALRYYYAGVLKGNAEHIASIFKVQEVARQ